MKIGLVDIDGHAKKKKWGATIYPNLALGKIARYHKMQGDEVEWAIPFWHYDKIYISKIFNFSPDDRTAWNADEIIRGGTGYDINSKLPTEIDMLQPDYTIYPNVPTDTAYGFLTRGCPNHCAWCVVPKKEGGIMPYMDVDQIAIEGRTNLVLMDNNILAARDYATEQLTKIINRGYHVDFNQALDARLVDDHFARLLAKVKWIKSRIRFGCDTKRQITDCEKAIRLIQSYGYRGEFFLYTIINDNFDESYQRISYWWHRYRNVYPYAQPYRDPVNPKPIPQWQKDIAGWVNKHAIFKMTDFGNFEPRKGFKCKQYFKTTSKQQQ